MRAEGCCSIVSAASTEFLLSRPSSLTELEIQVYVKSVRFASGEREREIERELKSTEEILDKRGDKQGGWKERKGKGEKRQSVPFNRTPRLERTLQP